MGGLASEYFTFAANNACDYRSARLNAPDSGSISTSTDGNHMRNIEQYLIDTADRCVELARAGRDMANSLEALSNDLMAKAVELDSERDRRSKDEQVRSAAKRKV